MNANLNEVPILATKVIVAKFLSVSERTVWQMGDDGDIRTVRFGRSVRYYLRDFLERKLNTHGQPQ